MPVLPQTGLPVTAEKHQKEIPIMGDKGGKKDKDKARKQQEARKLQEEKKKQDKRPRKNP